MLTGKLFKYWTDQLFAPEKVLKEKYAAFKSLLAHDKDAHELVAELEEIYHTRQKKDFSCIVALCKSLSDHVAGIVDDLSRICPACYPDLMFFYKKIDAYLHYMTAPNKNVSRPPYVCDLDDAETVKDLNLVGGKAYNLGIVKNILELPVPDGCVLTTNAYHHFLEHNALREKIDTRLAAVDIDDTAALDAMAKEIQELIMTAEVPEEIRTALSDCHRALAQQHRGNPGVAMRSSAVGEDAGASFAGQYVTVLNVNPTDLEPTYKEIIAGKYSPRSIYYRISYGYLDEDTPMAVLVLNMVDAMSSGVTYTTDFESPEAEHLQINAIWGLGDYLVSGQTPADMFTVSKAPPLRIIQQRTATKSLQMVDSESGRTELKPLDPDKAAMISLDDTWVRKLAEWGIALEKYFQEPQDIEWAIDRSGRGYILQTRPLNLGTAPVDRPTCNFEDISNDVLLQGGERAASGISAGTVFNLGTEANLEAVPENAVLVAQTALPRYAKVINRLSAVVTDAGSAASHFASVAREFGVPALVNTRKASTHLEHGQTVTVHADAKTVYAGTVTQMLESPCAKTDLIIDSPFMRKLDYMIQFVSPLSLVDPDDRGFVPQRCRSLHDVIRFAHEKAVQEMFHVSDKRMRKLSFAKKLASKVPLNFYVLDVGGGLHDNENARREIHIDQVRNKAMRALWSGLTHPDIQWGAFSHFDWETYDKIVMSGGIASPEAAMFASHAVISDDYMNLNLKFGYHFVIVDALCGNEAADNTIMFRFSGGGADLEQRLLRAEFLKKILERLGLAVSVKSDLIDAQLLGADLPTCLERLDMLGRLLGATRLMDMYLKDAAMVDGFVDDFMQGRYDYASVE